MPIEEYNFDEYVKNSLDKGIKEQPSELLWKRLNDQLKRNDVQHRNFMRLSITAASLSCLAVLFLALAWNKTDTRQKVSKNVKISEDFKSLETNQDFKSNSNSSSSVKEERFVASENTLNSSIKQQYRQSIKENVIVSEKFKSSGTNQKFTSSETNQNLKSSGANKDFTSSDIAKNYNFSEITQGFKSSEAKQDYKPNETNQDFKNAETNRLKYLNAAWKPQELAFVKAYHRPQKLFTKWAMRLDINPGIAVLKIKDGGNNSPFNAKYFEQNQLSSLVPNASLNLKYHNPKGFIFSAGIGLSSVVTNFDSPNNPIHYDSIHHQYEFESSNGHMQVHENDFDGEANQPWGPGGQWEPGQPPPPNFHVRLQEKEVYTMIQIPVQLGYEFHFKRLKLFAQTGMVFSKTIYEKSEIRLNENHSIRDENDKDFNGIFFSHSFDLGAEFRLTSHLGLSISPNFRYFLTPLNPGSERLIYPRKYGLNIGLVYYFK